MKNLFFILLTGCILTCTFLLYPLETKAKNKSKFNFQQAVKTKNEDSIVTIVAVGDMMLGTNFPDASYLPSKELLLLEPMYLFLQNADLTFGNLEGTILNDGGDVKKCSDPTKCYAFRQPEYFADQFKIAGFDFLSLANNHMGDFGNAGRTNSQRILKEKNIHFAGLDDCPWDTLTINGVKYGFTAFAPNNFCLQITDYVKMEEIVSKLNKISDIVIVSFHGGAEGASKTHVTRKTEIFYEEDRGNVYEFAHKAIDAGADLVLGHGPHVTRAIDFYKGKFITYSMGNFCTYGRFNLKGVSGIAPIFELKMTKKGNFISGKVISTKQLGNGGPILDSLHGAFEQIKILTKEDFPELKINFMENGNFSFN